MYYNFLELILACLYETGMLIHNLIYINKNNMVYFTDIKINL